MGKISSCPRCGDRSLERLKTYSHCGQCLFFVDHGGPNESDLYDGLYELHPTRLRVKMERESRQEEFEQFTTERKENHENANDGTARHEVEKNG